MPQKDSESSAGRAIDILLVDDHVQVRKLLRQMIETYDDLKIIGEAVDGEEAVLLAVKLKPAVVVMDAHLPRLNGAEATRSIKKSNPSIAVIGLTAGASHDDETAMLNAGATSVIDKADALDALHRCIVDAVNQVNTPV